MRRECAACGLEVADFDVAAERCRLRYRRRRRMGQIAAVADSTLDSNTDRKAAVGDCIDAVSVAVASSCTSADLALRHS
jgi:hypothetical protein